MRIHPLFNTYILHAPSNDALTHRSQTPPPLVVVGVVNEWEVDEIVDSIIDRRSCGVQPRVKYVVVTGGISTPFVG